LFFVNVASKELTVSLSPLFAIYTKVRVNVASKGLTLRPIGAEKTASVFGDVEKSARGRLIGVATVQFMQKCSTVQTNCQLILWNGYHSNDARAGSGRFERR
jgi:hypothetical protein